MAIQTRTLARTLALTTICAAALGSGVSAPAVSAATAAEQAAGTLSFVARSTPNRLVQSTGNLYWTVNRIDEFGWSVSSVYRTSKGASPGQESLMYRQYVVGAVAFGAVTYAKVGGNWHHYVVVNDFRRGVSQIRRLPAAAGGATTTITTAPRLIGQGDLVTDGAKLFWADGGGVRSAPINGGAATRLVAGTAISDIGFDARYVYYASGRTVRRVPKTGGTPTVIATVASTSAKPSTVTALHIRPASPSTVVYWADSRGAVSSRAGSTVRHYQQRLNGRTATSVSFDGKRVLWADCTMEGKQCRVRQYPGGGIVSVPVGDHAHDVQGDATDTFFGITGGVKRFRR